MSAFRGQGLGSTHGATPGSTRQAFGGSKKKPPPLMDPTRERDRGRILRLFAPYRWRLVAVLGDPKVCPHGLPIPPADLSAPPRIGERLSEAQAGTTVRVVEVVEDVPETLRYLDRIGLRPGAQIDVVERGPLGGPITIEGASGRTAISIELARLIAISPEASPALSA